MNGSETHPVLAADLAAGLELPAPAGPQRPPAALLAAGGQYLAFTLGREVYAMAIGAIREIIPFGGMTEVPLMPACIRGVINLRGSVVPVADLQARFRRPPTQVGPRTCVVIVELFQDGFWQDLGFLVDQVNEVLTLDQGAISPPPAFGAALPPGFIAGVAQVQGRFVMILDAERTLAVAEMVQEPVHEFLDPAGPSNSWTGSYSR